MTPEMITFPGSPIHPPYEALGVRVAGQAYVLHFIDGRQCYVAGSTRTRTKVGRRFYNALIVRYLDGTAEAMGAAEFTRRAKAP